MAALGWLGCAAVVVAWAGSEALGRLWAFVNRTEVLAVFEDAETTHDPVCAALSYDDEDSCSCGLYDDESPIVGRLAEFEAGRALTDDRIADFLDGWEHDGGESR